MPKIEVATRADVDARLRELSALYRLGRSLEGARVRTSRPDSVEELACPVLRPEDPEIDRRLEETIAWFRPGLHRDDDLLARSVAGLWPPGDDHSVTWSRRVASALPRVAQTRREALAPSDFLRDRRSPLAGGRALVYWPDLTLRDGSAAFVAEGLFDECRAPAFATWVAFLRDARGGASAYLVAWIPPPAIEAAQRAIDVNPEQCIAWLEDSCTSLARIRCPR